MTVTLSDIARQVGTSKMTVSQALRGTGRIGSATRRRILDAAKELAYRPNAAAQAVSTGKFGSIGLLLSSDVKRSYLPHQLLEGIQGSLEAHDTHLTLGQIPDAVLLADGCIPALLRRWSVDGLLINYQEGVPQPLIELVDRAGVPAVWINSRQRQACVYPDEFGAALRASEHLLELGHRRIAYVDASHGSDDFQIAHFSARDRQAGYETAMTRAGLPARIERGPKVLEAEQRVPFFHTLLADPDRPTGVVAYSSTNVIPLAVAGLRLGIEIPRDLSVVTFDEHPSGSLGYVLTSLISPMEAMGRRAAELLLERIGNPDAPTPHVQAIPFEFVLGQSTARPGQSSNESTLKSENLFYPIP